MGFQQGLSGLNASSRNLDVIGHNVANANTVGAKASRAEFADAYATAVSSSGFTGLGVQVSTVTQQFSQGDLVSTSNPLDLAVNGEGFFRTQSEAGDVSYTRNGQFQLDKSGYIVTSSGDKLTGYPIDAAGNVIPAASEPMQITTADIEPKLTTTMRAVLNLDTREEVPTVAAFDVINPESYNAATSLDVFDEQGRDTTLALYFAKTAANEWDVYATADGTQIGAAPIGDLTFGDDGRLDETLTTMPIVLAVPNASGPDINMDVDLSEIVQFGSAFGINELEQDGYTTGRLSSFNVEDDGRVVSRYSNGETLTQGQITLTNFANPQGLVAVGDNAWVETFQSGSPVVGAPQTAALGGIQSGALEQSNVDLTGELVNMIMAQRSYQANAQTVKAQDQILQTIVNLR